MPSRKETSEIEEQESLLPKAQANGATSSSAAVITAHRRAFTVEELQVKAQRAAQQQQEHEEGPGGAQGAAHEHPRYESLDFEEVENTVYRSDRAASSTLDSVTYAATKWLVCLLIGMITAMTAFVVNFAVENISGWKFWVTLTLWDRGHGFGSFLVYAVVNAALVILAVGVTLLAPAAVGSGITEVKAYLNGIDVPGIFYLTTLAAKVVGSVGAVAGGLAIGKEGPFVHAGACIAALVSQGGPPGYQSGLMQHLWNDRDRAEMVTAGAAAGVAAAFRSPVGGVLFALEEMSSWWRNQLMWYIFFTTAVVSVTVRVLMKMCSGEHCGFFGAGGFIYFEIQEGQDAYEVFELVPMLLLGVIGGLLGSAFIALNARLAAWRRKHLSQYGPRGRLLEGLAISGLTSAVSFILPLLFHCQQCPAAEADVCPRRDNAHSGNFVSFGCTHPNQYSDLATLFFNTQDDAIRALFSSRTQREYTVPALITFVTAFYWLAVLTYGVTCPVGLFVPSILCGAAYGRLVGIFVADMYPTQHIDEGTYALLGAASFLGGSMRMTVCICVMLLELTNNLALLPLIMLVLLVSKAVGDGTGIHPIYEVQMEYKGLPFLQPTPDPIMRHITARECCGKPPVTLQRVEKVNRIVDVLKSCSHNGFPVLHTSVDGETALVGVVLRQHLLRLLTTRAAFQMAPYVTETASRVATSFCVADFSKPISTPGLSISDVQLSRDELSQYLDLGPYLNPSYYVVQDDASLSKVYTLFRTLGLRHICVIPRAADVVGLISREDLLPGTLAERLARSGQYGTDGTLGAHGMATSRSRRGVSRLDSRDRSRSGTPEQAHPAERPASRRASSPGTSNGGGHHARPPVGRCRTPEQPRQQQQPSQQQSSWHWPVQRPTETQIEPEPGGPGAKSSYEPSLKSEAAKDRGPPSVSGWLSKRMSGDSSTSGFSVVDARPSMELSSLTSSLTPRALGSPQVSSLVHPARVRTGKGVGSPRLGDRAGVSPRAPSVSQQGVAAPVLLPLPSDGILPPTLSAGGQVGESKGLKGRRGVRASVPAAGPMHTSISVAPSTTKQ